jgi:hypothetical protein
MVVEAFELDAAKTGAFRKTLGKLGVGKTTLLVDGGKEAQPGAEFAQHSRRGTGSRQPGASVSSAAMKRQSFPSLLWSGCRIR